MNTHRQHVLQEQDRIRTLLVFYLLVAIVVIGSALVTWAWFALRANETAHGITAPIPGAIRVVGISTRQINQTLINVDTSAKVIERQAEQQMADWGWVDRDRRIVHMPIEAAMQVVTGTLVQQ